MLPVDARQKMVTAPVGLLCFFTFLFQGNGVPRFANYLQDHMVLQRAPQRAIVWGYGDPSAVTTLTVNNRTYTTIGESEPANAQNESIWSVKLDPVSDEGPHLIHVTQPLPNGTLYKIELRDVLFGDVWICSGQSNMQLTVGMIYNGSEEIVNAANYPKIRVFTSWLHGSATPLEELFQIRLKWSLPSNYTIGGPDWDWMSAVCWLYGRMIHQALNGRPIGLIATSYGGTRIEYWMPPEALHDCNITSDDSAIIGSDDAHFNADLLNSTTLYNAMIYPFTRMVIYGVVWYQGESNRGYNVDKYACAFEKMIQYWREGWFKRTNRTTDREFPFGFVQLGTWAGNTSWIGGFPWIRWHQTFDVGYAPNHVLPNIFMAVACDLRDDPNGIHPRYKHDVGYRLSRSGLAVAYEQQVEFQGPIVQNVSYAPSASTVNITYTAVSSIELRNPDGFEVCCLGQQCSNDTLWAPSPVTSKDALTIMISINSTCVGKQLYGLRYLWRETPCAFKQAAIYSGTDSNLPSPPYLKLF